MSAFSFAVEHTLAAEGVFSDHPDDRGGATKFGITEETARSHGYDGAMEHLGRQEAVAIYRLGFWDPLRLDDIGSRYIAAEIFDTAVNMGPAVSVRIAQRACNLMGLVDALQVDGVMGPNTRDAINSIVGAGYERHLYHAMNGFQFVRYAGLADEHEWARTFIRGWMRRLGRFREMAWEAARETNADPDPNGAGAIT